jgi:hypothetical protein
VGLDAGLLSTRCVNGRIADEVRAGRRRVPPGDLCTRSDTSRSRDRGVRRDLWARRRPAIPRSNLSTCLRSVRSSKTRISSPLLRYASSLRWSRAVRSSECRGQPGVARPPVCPRANANARPSDARARPRARINCWPGGSTPAGRGDGANVVRDTVVNGPRREAAARGRAAARVRVLQSPSLTSATSFARGLSRVLRITRDCRMRIAFADEVRANPSVAGSLSFACGLSRVLRVTRDCRMRIAFEDEVRILRGIIVGRGRAPDLWVTL